MKLRAPYNFVPLSSDGVFHPDWAERISMDVPFKDGMTGVIDVTFKAESPIFVRNGLSKMLVTEDIRRSICPNDYNRFNHRVPQMPSVMRGSDPRSACKAYTDRRKGTSLCGRAQSP